MRNLSSAAVLFSGPHCGVCHAIAPRIHSLLETRFPKMALIHVDIEAQPEAARLFEVTAIPTLIVFFEGREHHRLVRVFGVDEAGGAIERPYALRYP